MREWTVRGSWAIMARRTVVVEEGGVGIVVDGLGWDG